MQHCVNHRNQILWRQRTLTPAPGQVHQKARGEAEELAPLAQGGEAVDQVEAVTCASTTDQHGN